MAVETQGMRDREKLHGQQSSDVSTRLARFYPDKNANHSQHRCTQTQRTGMFTRATDQWMLWSESKVLWLNGKAMISWRYDYSAMLMCYFVRVVRTHAAIGQIYNVGNVQLHSDMTSPLRCVCIHTYKNISNTRLFLKRKRPQRYHWHKVRISGGLGERDDSHEGRRLHTMWPGVHLCLLRLSLGRHLVHSCFHLQCPNSRTVSCWSNEGFAHLNERKSLSLGCLNVSCSCTVSGFVEQKPSRASLFLNDWWSTSWSTNSSSDVPVLRWPSSNASPVSGQRPVRTPTESLKNSPRQTLLI